MLLIVDATTGLFRKCCFLYNLRADSYHRPTVARVPLGHREPPFSSSFFLQIATSKYQWEDVNTQYQINLLINQRSYSIQKEIKIQYPSDDKLSLHQHIIELCGNLYLAFCSQCSRGSHQKKINSPASVELVRCLLYRYVSRYSEKYFCQSNVRAVTCSTGPQCAYINRNGVQILVKCFIIRHPVELKSQTKTGT